jgi:hypothetical protein
MTDLSQLADATLGPHWSLPCAISAGGAGPRWRSCDVGGGEPTMCPMWTSSVAAADEDLASGTTAPHG